METLKKITIETKKTKVTKFEKLYNEIKKTKDANPSNFEEKKYLRVILSFVFLIILLCFSVTLHLLSYFYLHFDSSPYPLIGILITTILFSFFNIDVFKDIKKNDEVNKSLYKKIHNYDEKCFKDDENIYGSKITTLKFDSGFNNEIKYKVKKGEYIQEIKFFNKSEIVSEVVNVIGVVEDIENLPDETIFKIRTLDTDLNLFESF
jgi:hypothetical protein